MSIKRLLNKIFKVRRNLEKNERELELLSEFINLPLKYKEILEHIRYDLKVKIMKDDTLSNFSQLDFIPVTLLREFGLNDSGLALSITKNDEIIALTKIKENKEINSIEILSLEIKERVLLKVILAKIIEICHLNYQNKDLLVWVDIEFEEDFSSLGFNPFIGQIEEIDSKLVSLFRLTWNGEYENK